MKNINKQNFEDDSQIVDQVTPENINTDVYNALSLCNEELAVQYEKEGYNPFEKEFKLTKEYVQEILDNKKEKAQVQKADFLEYGNKKVSSYFKNALANTDKLIAKLEFSLDNHDFSMEAFKQIQKNLISLKNRKQLLKTNIAKLRDKNADSLRMYISMFDIDKELSELLKESFESNFNLDSAINNVISLAVKRANKIKALRLKDEKEKEDREKKEKERELNLFGLDDDDTPEDENQDGISLEDIAEAAIETATDVAESVNDISSAVLDSLEQDEQEEFEQQEELEVQEARNNNHSDTDELSR